MTRRAVGMLCGRLVVLLVVMLGGFANGQLAWNTGYPKLGFGSQMLSPSEVFPLALGARPAVGGVPHELLLHLSVAGPMGDPSFTLNMPDFFGGDNSWRDDSNDLACYTKVGGVVTPSTTCFRAGQEAVKWESSVRTLKLDLEDMTANVEYIVALSALSFKGGKGPLPPACLRRGAPIIVSSATESDADRPQLATAFQSVSPIGCFSDAGGANRIGVAENTFVTAAIGQDASRNSFSTQQTLTVTIASNLDLSSIQGSIKSTISITGLVNTQTDDTNALAISSQLGQGLTPLQVFLPTASWSKSSGTLTLTVADGATLPARVQLVLTFSLKLPASPTAAPRVSIEAKTGTTVVIPSTEMQSASGGSAPLHTEGRALTFASIGQKVSGPGQSNTLSISLTPNFDLQSTAASTATITLSGLVGFTNPDSNTQNPVVLTPTSVDSVAGIFVVGETPDRAEWHRETGMLVMRVKEGMKLAAGNLYTMRVAGLMNPFSPQASPDIHIQVGGDSPIAKSAMAKPQGHTAPLFVTSPTFHIAKVGQSSTTVGARNVLSVTLMSNVGIETVAASQLTGTISISGLVGFKDDDGDYPLVNGGFSDVSAVVQGSVARWTKSTGTLAVTVAAGYRLEAGEAYTFYVVLTNPNNAQQSPSLFVEVTGTDAVKINKLPLTKGSGASAPLLVLQASLDVARIGQASSGAAMPNTLTFTLQPNLRLAVDTRITLQGLAKTATQDSNALPVAGCPSVFKSPTSGTLNHAKWNSAAGTLEVLVAAEMAGGEMVVCSFDVTNPSEEQDASSVRVTVSTQGTTLINGLLMRNALMDRAPLRVSSNKFVTARIGQSSPYPSVRDNVVTVTLAFNVALATAGAVESAITIRGLTGSTTSSTASLSLSGDEFVAALGSGVGTWDREAGSLTLSVAASKSLPFNVPFVFSFRLDNPSGGQPAPEVTVSASGGQVILNTRMHSDDATCIHQPGDAAPLFIYTPGFLTRDIATSVTAQGAKTRITVTLLSSVALASIAGSQTIITISGLTGYTDPDSSSLPVTSSTDSFGPTASWARDSGILTLPISIGTVLSPGTETARIQLTLTNGPSPATPEPKISIGGLTGQGGAAAAMHFKTRHAEPTIQFGATVTGLASSLDLSFSAVHPISQGDTILLTLPSVSCHRVADGSAALWGLTSSPPAFSVHASEQAHQDALSTGDAVATATFREGFSGRTAAASSDFDGEEGTSLKLDMADARVFEAVNVYAGMAMRIEGSSGTHTIYHQQGGGPSRPAVAHFYPKFRFGTGDPSHVAAHTRYEVLSHLELVAKSDICSGTRVNISVPASSGLLLPTSGVQAATISHLRMGTASSLALGSLSDMGSNTVQYSGTRGRLVAATLAQQLPTGLSYIGSPFAPTVLPSPYFPWIDGHRLLSTFNSNTKAHEMLSGYGPVKKTAMLMQVDLVRRRAKQEGLQAGKAAKLWSVRGGSLKETQSLTGEAGATHVWLRFDPDSLAGMQPRPVRGSVMQIKTEQIRFTGEVADSLKALGGARMQNCHINGKLCETADGCFTATLPGASCLTMPTWSLEMTLGNFQGITVTHPGVCTAANKLTWPAAWTPAAAAGVVCDGNDYCDNLVPGSDCQVDFDDAFSVLRVQRRMFSSTAISLTCSAAAPCTDVVAPSLLHVAERGLAALQYTQSPSELDLANQQHLRLGYEQTVLSVASGDHVVSLSLPETIGSNCQLDNNLCDGHDCADIFLTGCSLNPTASVTFTGGSVSGISVDASSVVGATTPAWMQGDGLDVWGNSLCKSDDKLVGQITLKAGVVCAQGNTPACGSTGCQPTLDTTKDALLFRYQNTPANGLNLEGDVVRVHPAQAGVAFQIVVVPETGLLRKDTHLSADRVVLAPMAGTTYTWTDPATGEVMSRITATGGITNLQLKYATNPDGSMVTYNESCKTACNTTGAGGFLIGSRRVVLSFDLVPGFANANVNLSLPTIFNNKGVLPVRRLHAAPPGYEFRINADCACPANMLAQDTMCKVFNPGEYQALLVPVSKCAASTPMPEELPTSPVPMLTPLPNGDGSSYNPWIVVGGVLGGAALALLCMFGGALWMRSKKRATAGKDTEPMAVAAVHRWDDPNQEQADKEQQQPDVEEAPASQYEGEGEKPEGSSEETELTEEGPVFVGRPVPVTPELMLSMSPGVGLGTESAFFRAGTLGGNGSGANWSYAGMPESALHDTPSHLGGFSPSYTPSSVAFPHHQHPYPVFPPSATYPADLHNRSPSSPVVISSPVLAAQTSATGLTGNRRAVDLQLALHDRDRGGGSPQQQRVPYGV